MLCYSLSWHQSSPFNLLFLAGENKLSSYKSLSAVLRPACREKLIPVSHWRHSKASHLPCSWVFSEGVVPLPSAAAGPVSPGRPKTQHSITLVNKSWLLLSWMLELTWMFSMTSAFIDWAMKNTSWSELLYMKAFWNMSSMSLWNSMSVRICCTATVKGISRCEYIPHACCKQFPHQNAVF